MSISTTSIGSSCRSCSSDDALQAGQLEGWKNELVHRCHVFEGSLDEYLDVFVPTNKTLTLPAPDINTFATFTPIAGHELESYDPLVKGLKKVVARFPKNKKFTFFQNCRAQLLFPFKDFQGNHHACYPDIAVSLPGETLRSGNWLKTGAFIEVKDTKNEDPFSGAGLKHSKTLVQMAVDAQGLMVAHGHTSAFILGIYGEQGRLVHFDHSCAVASPAFNIKESARLLQHFFWRLAHPANGGGIVGCDPTVRKLTVKERHAVSKILADAGEDALEEPEMMRRVLVYQTNEGGVSVTSAYILLRLIDINARLLSRATSVWVAMKDPRDEAQYQRGDRLEVQGKLELVVVKDAWRQSVRKPETDFYDRMKTTIAEKEWLGLPRLIAGCDLGERDIHQWIATKGHDLAASLEAIHSQFSLGPSTPLSTFPPTSSPTPTPAPIPDPSNIATTSGSASATHIDVSSFLPLPDQVTCSWRIAKGLERQHLERSHMRVVVDTLGRRLTGFRSTRELVQALHDAVVGHKILWEKAKILHHDVSVGNILIVEKEGSRPFTGFLHDFDYSSMAGIPLPSGSDLKQATAETLDEENLRERTGTYFFMSIELLEEDGVVHGPHHDLESVYWILIWIILRHTRHDSRATNKACGNLFKFGSDGDSADAKRSWLSRKGTIAVIDNAPLSWLIQEFTVLAYKHLSSRDGPGVSLTHDAVLKIFDQALRRTDWPEKDGAIAFKAPDLRTKGLPTNTTTASSKKRKEQPEGEGLRSNATAASGSSKRTKTHASGSQPSTASSRGGKSSRGSSKRRGAARR